MTQPPSGPDYGPAFGQPYGEQPYGQPPPFLPPPPPPQPPTKRGLSTGGIVAIVIGGVIALCMVGGIVSAVSSGGKDPGTDAAASPAATGDGEHAAAKVPAAAATTAAAKARTLLQLSGSGIKTSAKFTVGDTWKLAYTYDCSNFGTSGNFQVYEDYPDGDIMVNELGDSGSDSTVAYDSGTHFVEVNSECAWTIKVTG